jgi:hypothetical protein
VPEQRIVVGNTPYHVIFLRKGVFMRTTLDLPDETFRQLKAQAALNGMKLKELVTQLIQRGLAAGVTDPKSLQPPDPPPIAIKRVAGTSIVTDKAPAYPIPIAREADGSVTPYLTNAQLHDILNEQDLAQYQRVLKGQGGQ